jgi:hypothetical protein
LYPCSLAPLVRVDRLGRLLTSGDPDGLSRGHPGVDRLGMQP